MSFGFATAASTTALKFTRAPWRFRAEWYMFCTSMNTATRCSRCCIWGWCMALALETEFADNAGVAPWFCLPEIIEELFPAHHHAQQAPPGVVVLRVFLEVLREARDLLGEERYLDLARTRIRSVRFYFSDDFSFFFRGKHAR